jgi:hypothetical protein
MASLPDATDQTAWDTYRPFDPIHFEKHVLGPIYIRVSPGRFDRARKVNIGAYFDDSSLKSYLASSWRLSGVDWWFYMDVTGCGVRPGYSARRLRSQAHPLPQLRSRSRIESLAVFFTVSHVSLLIFE